MFAIGNDVFLQLAGESRGMLHPSKVVEIIENSLIVELEADLDDAKDKGMTLEIDQEILIYFNQKRNFVKQAARIDDVIPSVVETADANEAEETPEQETGQDQEDDAGRRGLLVRMVPCGEPVSAENRQCFRVSTVVAGLTAAFAGADDCPLVDVSATGFAVISKEQFPIGKVVEAAPRYEDLQPAGPVCIQSVRSLRDGRYRYGVHCVEKRFQEEVQALSMAIQRRQLQRLACIA